MNKHRNTCLISVVCYSLYILAALVFLLIMQIELSGIPAEGNSLGEGLGRALLMILMILVGVAGGAALVPLGLKIWHIFLPKTFLSVLCILFDLAYAVLFFILLINGLQEDGIAGMALAAVGLVAAIVSLVANSIAIRTGREEAYYR